jgi:hypothetical protein
MSEPIEARAFEAVARHPRFADLVTVTRNVAVAAAKARVLEWKPLAGTELLPETRGAPLRQEDTSTDFGNAWTVLERGPKTREEEALVRALWAHAVAEAETPSTDAVDTLAGRVVWLAAFTPFDATLLLDRALGDSADAFWQAVAVHLERLDKGDLEAMGRGEARAAAGALSASSSATAAAERSRLLPRVTDPSIRALLGPTAEPRAADTHLAGEMAPAPRAPALTVLLALTGILLVVGLGRLIARLALAYRRPADVSVTSAGVRVRWRTSLLGRRIKDHDVLFAKQGLARATREVRYPRAAFYAGLFSLAVGSLFGVRTFMDGVRAASPSLLFWGLLVIATGVGLDFLLSLVAAGGKGRCRVVFVGRDGTALAVRDVDATGADKALARLVSSSA